MASQTGCQVGASASGGTLFPSVRLEDGDEFDLGEFKLKVLHTPGHTPEHISFLIEEQGEPTAIFTGGALIVGGAARVDLLGSRVAPFLARWLHQTIHGVLLKLPDSVRVYPTHGGGSFGRRPPHMVVAKVIRPLARSGNTIPLLPRQRKATLSSSPSLDWVPTPAITSTWPT